MTYTRLPDAVQRYRKAKRRNQVFIAACALAIFLVLGGGAYWLGRTLAADAAAAPAGSAAGVTEQEVLSQLQQQADAGMFSFEISPTPSFEAPDAEGLLALRNPAQNALHMRVSITLDGADEIIYESPVLEPGQQLLWDKLSAPPGPGEYAATATVEALDPHTQDVVSTASMELTLTVGG